VNHLDLDRHLIRGPGRIAGRPQNRRMPAAMPGARPPRHGAGPSGRLVAGRREVEVEGSSLAKSQARPPCPRCEATKIEVREAERGRLARDLHDGPLQDLSVVVQQLEVRRREAGTQDRDAALGREVATLRRSVRGLREAIYDLRPGDGRAFLEQVGSMVCHYRDLTPEREISLVVEEDFPPDLPDAMVPQLLRLAREALSNARQHSAARRVWVTLGTNEDDLEIEVADDGGGFVAETAVGGMGLSTMRERAVLLGGNLEVRSEPGEGTRVRLRLPRPDRRPEGGPGGDRPRA